MHRKGVYTLGRNWPNSAVIDIRIDAIGMRGGRCGNAVHQLPKISNGSPAMVVHRFSGLLLEERIKRFVLDIANKRGARPLLEGALLGGRVL